MTIYLAGNLITNISALGFGHLQLVRDGMEIEVQAPQPWFTLGYWQFPGERPHSVPDGATIGDPVTYSSEAVELADGISEDGVWSIFAQASENLSEYSLPYDVFFNSNSFANTLLNLVGHSAQEFISYPTDVTSYPGMSADAAQMGWGVEWTITGSGGGDLLRGGWETDRFEGGGGTDFLDGRAGDDHLYGGTAQNAVDDSADYLTGGQGRDAFYVGNTLGNGRLFSWDAALGDYAFDTSSRGTYDVITDFSTADTALLTIAGYWDPYNNVELSNYTLENMDSSMGGKDRFFVNGGGGGLLAIYDSYYDQNLDRNVNLLVFFENELYTPIFAIAQSLGPVGFSLLSSIDGTATADFLIGTASGDTIHGGAGDDEIEGAEGSDELYGEDGNDLFYAAEGDGVDVYDGGAGRDTLSIVSEKNTTINLKLGTVSASGEGTDTVTGVEAFVTGAGDDTFIDDESGQSYNGGEGNDLIAFEFDASDYRISTSGSGYLIERAYVDRDADIATRYLTVKNIENFTFNGVVADIDDATTVNVTGTAAGETLNGSNRNDFIQGGGGNDILYGGLGSDILDGGEGTNQVRYDGILSDYFFKENTDGTISIVSAVYGHDLAANVQTVRFTGDNSTYDIEDLLDDNQPGEIVGTSGDDVLSGTSGTDVIRGGLGNDTLQGGAGSDTYRYSAGDGADVIDDWADPTSTDLLELSAGISPSAVTVERGNADIWDVVLGFGNGDSVTIKGGFFAGSSVIEEVRFADNTVWDVADLRQIHLDQRETAGNDTIDGFIDVNDLIHGGGGNDTIYAFSGNDTIYGDAGDDEIFGNEGDDTIIGGTGNDFMIGEAGSDVFVLHTGDGEDWINDFEVGVDKIDLSAITSISGFSELTANAAEWVAGSTWLYTDPNNYVRLEGVSLASLQASDFIFA
jgi:Ca2+-binding RTX toxin-like protein